MFHSDLMTLWYCLDPEKASVRFVASQLPCRGWGSASLSPQLLQLVQPFFLQILLFSRDLSSFPLLQHWLLPV